MELIRVTFFIPIPLCVKSMTISIRTEPSWQGRLLKILLRLRTQYYRYFGGHSIEARRASLEFLTNLFETTQIYNRQSVDVDGVAAEWITIPGSLAKTTILYLHGGGYSGGSISTHRSLVAEISKAAQAKALVIEYRLAPEYCYPAPVEDALTAFHWLLSQGVPPEDIVVAGDSAGGGLALALLIALRDTGDQRPACAVCLSPWTDLTGSGESMFACAGKDLIIAPSAIKPAAELYLRGADPQSPLASPLYANLSDLPPILIQVGSDEVLLSDSTSFAERARRAELDITLEVWENMQHVWQFAARYLPEARQAIHRIGDFILESTQRYIIPG
jgi:acetyl esterase/lipase